jgi:hypothetical protein
VTTVNDDSDHDQDTCCNDGSSLPKLGNDLPTLLASCPARTQYVAAGHEIDGCSNSPDDPMRILYPIGLLAVTGDTRFGSVVGNLPHPAPAQTLPCNRHDICYQTCGQTQQACDAAIRTDIDGVCAREYPSTCPFSGVGIVLCPAFFEQRAACFGLSLTYETVLGQFGASAFEERQQQRCQCC